MGPYQVLTPRCRDAQPSPNIHPLNVQCPVTLDHQYRLIAVFGFPPKKDTMKFLASTQPG
jgi:hypothetical protein